MLHLIPGGCTQESGQTGLGHKARSVCRHQDAKSIPGFPSHGMCPGAHKLLPPGACLLCPQRWCRQPWNWCAVNIYGAHECMSHGTIFTLVLCYKFQLAFGRMCRRNRLEHLGWPLRWHTEPGSNTGLGCLSFSSILPPFCLGCHCALDHRVQNQSCNQPGKMQNSASKIQNHWHFVCFLFFSVSGAGTQVWFLAKHMLYH